MKKTGLLFFMLVLFISNANSADYKDFKPTKSLEQSKNTKQNEVSLNKPEKPIDEQFLREVQADFQKVMGVNDKDYKILLKKGLEDKYFTDGLKKYYFERRYAKDKNGKELSKMKIPKYKEALKDYYRATVMNQDILAAYEGLELITTFIYQNGFFSNSSEAFKGNPSYDLYHDKYLPAFSNLLAKHNFCYGYLYKTRVMLENHESLDDVLYIGKKGLDLCNKQEKEKKTMWYLAKGMRLVYGKAKALKIVREAKDKKGSK